MKRNIQLFVCLFICTLGSYAQFGVIEFNDYSSLYNNNSSSTIIESDYYREQSAFGDPIFFRQYNHTLRNREEIFLENGIYKLKTIYDSHRTSEKIYLLNVCIKNDNITHIFFENQGYLHSGKNSSGYTWRGGGIKWSEDGWGNIEKGTAVVIIDYETGWKRFTFKIE